MYRITIHLTFTCILVRMAFAVNRTCLVGNDAPHPQDFNRVTVCGSHEHCQGSSVKSPDISICSQCCNNDICAKCGAFLNHAMKYEIGCLPSDNGGTCSIGTGNGNGSVFICTCRIGFSGDMCDRGLEGMHNLTRDGRHYQLRVELVDASGRKLYQVYDDFSIGGLAAFTLHVGANRGTAGDSLSGHDGFGFSSMLPNIDRDSNAASCAEYLQGNWWFHSCADSCLTCKYDIPGTNNCRSMAWNSVAYCQSLREVRMMVRPM
ncbi:ANGL2-like protein [Mya arenaria]|uniref:ANGL2-like protein n=1 Tax=Mya arenaria TaxID=6604 RepID=A0ABY7G7E7_MYAAR|nr:ANGL2-like protein [Mya arenaria]